MNKNILTFMLAMLIALSGFSQILTGETITFFGLDFSKAKMIGEGFNDPAAIKSNLFNSWNALFRVEPDKYDIGAALKKKATYDFDNVNRNNKTVDADKLVTMNDYSITAAEAESVIKKYDTKGKTGLGGVFVVESFDKTKVKGFIYIILFDMATKKVIINRKLDGDGGGFGLKNYWAKAIRQCIEESAVQYKKNWVKGQ